MTKKKVTKTEIVEDGNEQNSKAVKVSVEEEDPHMVTNLKNLNALLVKQTMELRQQVASLNIIKEKLELVISQEEQKCQTFMAERDLYVQKLKDSKEGKYASKIIFDVERMLNLCVISSAISQRNEENEKWKRRLESRLQKEQEKHQALVDAWRIKKEALENDILDRENQISELVRTQESIENLRRSEKVEMENIITSQETKIARLIEMNEITRESWKTEKDALQSTLSTLELKICGETKSNEENKKTIELQDLHIQELKREAANLNSKIIDLINDHKDLESTYNKTKVGLQQSEEGHRRELSENRNLHEMISKLKSEMAEKETSLAYFKEEIDAIEKREAKWKKSYENASASGEKVLNMLRKTAEMLASYETGPLVVDSDDDADTHRYKEELDAICGSFRKRSDKIHEMAQKIDKIMVELGEHEKKASMNVWHNITSAITGAGVAFALTFIPKLRG